MNVRPEGSKCHARGEMGRFGNSLEKQTELLKMGKNIMATVVLTIVDCPPMCVDPPPCASQAGGIALE